MWIDVDQNTEEWFDLRIGKATSSNFAKIMANDGKSFGNPAIEYAQKIALELVTGERDETASFKNSYMDRGSDLEPVAIRRYEEETLYNVTNGGFNLSDDKRIGDSPDGKIGSKGSVEVKCVIPNTQWKRVKKGGIDSAYKWQIHGHIWLGEYDWCDFVSFCPEMPYNKQIHICRVEKDQSVIDQMKLRINEFIKEIDSNVKLLNK